ncbi:Translation protein, beta-barrel domain [Pseudocohnilembus persalinus]|uniref:Translation protein, beta-barrel domain n=1 Tax=Pseudocohnilembus persalinus TaxID=266149 RepID=A0A0V0QLG4_PSEPJ|nr:Translation protein, beta-barrel domain [Pseudocohnilembus persalinus]|eukprot:KRX02832.1 Translation protein, beta-barrel domain [Pseudocohnilembus persalinus]
MEQNFDFKISAQDLKMLTPNNVTNINIGVLGHIDSGKTSLARALSEITSTASLDKNPQSQQRKITLDLGFSAFFTKVPQQINQSFSKIDANKNFLQFTLVDCPGHASLIKTIIGGSSIIDTMFLVIDVNKGIQTQTAECLVIGELLINKMIVILNKIDMIPEQDRQKILTKKKETLKKVFSKTKFGANVPMVEVSAAVSANPSGETIGVQKLIETLLQIVEYPERKQEKLPFLFLIDHCFPIKGQGSVVTGTVIQGQIKAGDEIFFPQLNEVKKMKSMQMFKKSVPIAKQGDRVGMLVTQLDHNLIERGIACEKSAVKSIENAIIPISYFKFGIKSKAKYHITSGHQTNMATIKLFSCKKQDIIKQGQQQDNMKLDLSNDLDYEYEESYEDFQQKPNKNELQLYCLLEFEKPLLANLDSLLIGSKFDSDIQQNVCRLGFHGKILNIINNDQLKNLRIYRNKTRSGVVDDYTILIKDLFKKETKIEVFLNRNIRIPVTNNIGKISAPFGKSGKCKATFQKNVNFSYNNQESLQNEQNQQKEEQKSEENQKIDIVNKEVQLFYKKYLFQKQSQQKNENQKQK